MNSSSHLLFLLYFLFFFKIQQYRQKTINHLFLKKKIIILSFNSNIGDAYDLNYLYNNSKKESNLMYSFWREILRQNLSYNEIKYVLNSLYPYYKMNQKVFFFDPNKNVEFFENGIYGTDEVQKLIIQNQFPQNCSDRNYFLLPKHYSGIGSMIHVFGASLAKGMNMNRTVLTHPKFFNKFIKSPLCKGKPGLDCFFIPISNCTFTEKEILSNEQKFLPLNLGNRLEIPNSILPIIEKSATPKSLYYFYWRIQATYFMVRFNSITKEIISDFRKKFLINPKDLYDVSIHIRHGDKYKEMKLINTQFYTYPLEILHKLLKRKLSVFVSSDDPSAIDYFVSLDKKKYEISYFNYQGQEKVYDLNNLTNGFNNSIQSFSNLLESNKSRYLIGTLKSNWNRLILEVRLQNHHVMDLPYFEVGEIECITPTQCNYINSTLSFSW